MKRTFIIDDEPVRVDVLVSVYHNELGIHYCRFFRGEVYAYTYVLCLGDSPEGEMLTWGLVNAGYPWAVKTLCSPTADSVAELTPLQRAVLKLVPDGDNGLEKFKHEAQIKLQLTDASIGKVVSFLFKLKCIETLPGSKYLIRLTEHGREMQHLLIEQDKGLLPTG